MAKRIDTQRRTAQKVLRGWSPEIGELREQVWICTTVEKPDMNVSSIVKRPGVIEVRARVRPLSGDTILDYQAVMGEQDKPTMEVTIRNPPDVKVDIRHWVYHKGRFACSWLKVRTVEDMGGAGQFLLLRCSVDQVFDVRADPATQRQPPRWDDPGVIHVPEQI